MIRLVAVPFRSALVLLVTTVVGIAGFAWPFLTDVDSSAGVHGIDAPWLLLAVMPLLVLLVVTELSAGRLDAKAVAVLGLLAAVGTALRIPTGGVAGVEPVFFVFLPAGRVFGKGFGFLLGAVTLLASAVATGGVGPWLPFQMLAAAWYGFGAGSLPPARGRVEVAIVAAYGAWAALAYGLVLDAWSWPFGAGATGLAMVPGDPLPRNLARFWTYHVATGLGWDLVRAATVVVLMALMGGPVLNALRRVATKGAFAAAPIFVADGQANQAIAPDGVAT